jgi:hypothetical protein
MLPGGVYNAQRCGCHRLLCSFLALAVTLALQLLYNILTTYNNPDITSTQTCGSDKVYEFISVV